MLKFLRKVSRRPLSGRRSRRPVMECLEPRLPLSSQGLIEVGQQPTGALSDKIVYVHAGHGITWNGTGWGYQRPLLFDMVEDLGNQDQMTFFVDQLWHAGATVVPLRPVGNQTNEVILDNDDAGVTFTGAWSDSSASIYFGDAGDVPYRFASTSATETATAQYRPNLPEGGFYPVYAWTRYGSDRAADQLYRVHHSGGATEVTVNHRRVGNGLVYLGTYHFEPGTEGYVEISNRSSETGRVVIADMIRFGNGVGDLNFGGGVSGQPRENEAGLYWLQWHTERAQGVPSSTHGTSTVSSPPRYAEYMNREADGDLSDRVYVSYHSNAGGGSARGVLALLNGNNRASAATPNQFLLANTLGREVNDDLVAQDGLFEHDWFSRSVVTLDRSDIEFGEINNEVIGGEFDATIIETGFHDNQFDAQMLRDPKVREALARATTQGLVNYFRTVDGGATPDIDAPGRVTDVRAEATATGEVTLTWTPPTANSYNGSAPTGYIVYASEDGYGFDGGRFVSGGGSTTLTISGLDATNPYYFKVAAVNDGGQSLGSEVVAAKATLGGNRVLVVNGFDRLDRSLVPTEPFPSGGLADRVRPRHANSFDYSVQMASAIAAAAPNSQIDTTANENIISGAVNLTDYDAVFWILGEESSADDTFNATEQTAVASYLAQGGKLFVSGAEIGWDLDNLNNGRAFYNNSLRADYIADDANTYAVQGAAGSIFAGLSFSFDDGSQFYDAQFADVIVPNGGSLTALNYSGGAGGAAVQYASGEERLVMLAFPLETITTEVDRRDVMQRVVDFFNVNDPGGPTISLDLVLDNDDGPPTYTRTGPWTTSSDPGYEGGSFQFSLIGSAGVAQWQADLPLPGTAQVFVQYVAASNRATGAVYEVTSGSESLSRTIDQTANSLQWVSLGSLSVEAGPLTVSLDAGPSTGNGAALVVADAVRIVYTTPVTPSADYNGDLVVDAIDYALWREQLGSNVPLGTGADGNFDGVVDAADLDLWREQYGTVLPAPAAVAMATTTSYSALALASNESSLTLPLENFREAEIRSPWRPIRLGLESTAKPIPDLYDAALLNLLLETHPEADQVGDYGESPARIAAEVEVPKSAYAAALDAAFGEHVGAEIECAALPFAEVRKFP